MFASKITYTFYKSPLHDLVDVRSQENCSSELENRIRVINNKLMVEFDSYFSCNEIKYYVLFQIDNIDTKNIIFKGIFDNTYQLKEIYKVLNIVLSKYTNLKCKERKSEEISITELAKSFFGTESLIDVSIKTKNKKMINLCDRIKFLGNRVSSLDVSY